MLSLTRILATILILLVAMSSFAQDAKKQNFVQELTPQEQMIFNQIKNKDSRLEGIKLNGVDLTPGDRFNSKLKVYNDNNRIVRLKMSVNDVLTTKFCYKSPVMIEFGNSVRTKIERVQISNRKIVDAQMLKGNRDLLISMVTSIEDLAKEDEAILNSAWETTVWVERASDKEDYVFKFIAERCPSNGIMPYPSKIIVEERTGTSSPDDNLLISSDYITELTKNTERRNGRNYFKVNGFDSRPNSIWHSMSVSIGYKNLPKSIKKVDGRHMIKKPKFIVLDSNKQFEIKNSSNFLKYSSKKETDVTGVPTSRYNMMLQLTKKYMFEKKFVYMIVLYEDEDYHQFIKVPIYDLYKKFMEKKNEKVN